MDRELEGRIARVQARIEAAARRAGRDPADVTLVAVSKMQPAEAVAAAYAAGLRLFGENRVEEAGPKVEAVARLLAPAPAPAWHMIGHLQSRKAADVLPWAAMVHSLDSTKLAGRLSRAWLAAESPSAGPSPGPDHVSRFTLHASSGVPLPVLLEVNVSGEESKYGFTPEAAAAAVDEIAALPGLQLAGFMTMAPVVADPEDARPVFIALRTLRDELVRRHPAIGLHHLSMGMTDDFEVAVEEGATIVRIGRALFGEPQG